MKDYEVKKAIDRQLTPLPRERQPGIDDRSIGQVAVEKYKVGVNTDEANQIAHIYPYYDKDGTHVANKIRRKGEKAFYWEGNPGDAVLFGQTQFPPNGRAITVVEGELDALSAFEITGSRFPVVSVKSASSAVADVKQSYEYLNSFEVIVLAFDSDEPGQRAAEKVANLFEIGKVKILRLRHGKDANEYAQRNLKKEYIDEWFRSPTYTPSGLKLGKDMWDEIVNRPKHFSVDYPFSGLNRTTYGLRLSELVIVTAETGVGKTSVLKEIEHSLLVNKELEEKGMGVGFLHFEETNYDTVLGLLSIHNDKPYHLPDTERTEDELRKAYDAVINNDRVVVYDHFGSNNIDEVLAKIRHMAAMGCHYIVLDHLSIVVSDQQGDERKQLDEISTKLKMLCMEKNIAVIAVIHQNRQGQIRGTAGVEQLANIVFKLQRDRTDPSEWRRNITKITCEKNRFCGRTGPSAYLYYDEVTGRLRELDANEIRHYEEGGTGAGLEMVF